METVQRTFKGRYTLTRDSNLTVLVLWNGREGIYDAETRDLIREAEPGDEVRVCRIDWQPTESGPFFPMFPPL